MLARGALGNPWLFGRLLGTYEGEPTAEEVVEELEWVIACAEEHLGVERAGRYLRKFYPWYAERLRLTRREREPLVTAPTTVHAREAWRGCGAARPLAASLENWPNFATYRRLLHCSAPSGRKYAISMARETVLTPEGLEELKAKIDHLSGDRRREVAERIKEAREFGDISENAEYDDAKNEQAMLEKQISDLEEKLRSARVIDAKLVDTDTVNVGATVHVKDQKTDKSTKFKIVGSAEADPSENKLSNESPGRARPDRPQARRDRQRAGPPRPGAQAQDHQDRTLVASRRVDDSARA